MSTDAAVAAAVLAVDPAALGGCVLRARAGPARDAWLQAFRSLLPPGTPWLRLPPGADDDALLGGLDIAASLASARPVLRAGLAARAHGGCLVLPMAERVAPGMAGRLAGLLDAGECSTARDGMDVRQPARFGLVALDEGGEDEAVPAALADRLALHLEVHDLVVPVDAASVVRAREQWRAVTIGDDLVTALCEACGALGVRSLRASLLATRAARIHAAVHGHAAVRSEDAAWAVRCVLAPRATTMPAPADQPAPESPPPEPPDPGQGDQESMQANEQDLREQVLQAARAALPAGLLAAAAARAARERGRSDAGKAGAVQAGRQRGRPVGTVRGHPRGGSRLHLLQTLRAAAPWQLARAREWSAERGAPPKVHVRPDDFHVVRHAQRRRTTTVFAVDASGSAALHRLAEAKGAVELLLAECYVRRDEVAVVAFRGNAADVLLPPTRSLARAKRSLAGLPGGGGTPLASGVSAAAGLADAARRRGCTPLLVVLTDGKANIARDGQPGRERAMADAMVAARAVAHAGHAALVLDTAPVPQQAARQLAEAMGARYVPLPHADARLLSDAVLKAP